MAVVKKVARGSATPRRSKPNTVRPLADEVQHTPLRAMFDRVRTGLPFSEVEALQRAAELSLSQVSVLLGIPERTIARRKREGKLTTAESDRVDRAARVLSMAVATLGTEDKARLWMQRPNRNLEGETPLDLLDTDRGVRAVEDVLMRIDHGILG
jgi:putative toxin-antitoxin system antitoxin component (TIGR02293 family)